MLSEILQRLLPGLDPEVAARINDLHWKTQDSTSDSILFYKLNDDEGSQKDFSQRMKTANYAWLIVNKAHPELPVNSTVLQESEWTRFQKTILDALYPLPTLKLFALTGTNGKSTTTDLVLQLGEMAGFKGLSIGTLGVRENHKTLLDFGLTSPGFIDLRKFLFRYGSDKDFCVLEASSHALDQGRLFGLTFDAAGWLSFSQDHLDYHKTMDAYFNAKALIFRYLKSEARLYVPTEQVDLFEKLQRFSDRSTKAPVIEGALPVFFSTRFNRNNLEVAKAMVEAVFNIKLTPHFEDLVAPDGRFYIRPYGSNFIVVDFAHTPDALDNICLGIKTAFPEHRLKVLFGCGGDRDRAKRPLMAKAVEKWADEIIVTSDNPRSEDPTQIIDDIVQGITRKKYQRVVERPTAVRDAFTQLKEKEILLLAGKGHEDYILIHGVKHPYSDIQEVENFLSGKTI